MEFEPTIPLTIYKLSRPALQPRSVSHFCHNYLLKIKIMSKIKDLKKEHKKLKTITKRTTKIRLNDRTSDSWINLRELKKLKLSVKDKINQLKH